MVWTTILKTQLYKILNPRVGHVILQTSPRKSKIQSMTPNQWSSSYKSKHKDSLNLNKRLEAWSLQYKTKNFLSQSTLYFLPSIFISLALLFYSDTIIWLKHQRLLHQSTTGVLLHYFLFCRSIRPSRLTPSIKVDTVHQDWNVSEPTDFRLYQLALSMGTTW